MPKGKRSTATQHPTAAEIQEALAKAEAAARRLGCPDPENVAAEATDRAVRTWKGPAKLSTLAVRIAHNLAQRQVGKLARQGVAEIGHQDLTGVHRPARAAGRPKAKPVHSRAALRTELEARWLKATGQAWSAPRELLSGERVEMQRRAVNRLAESWAALLEACRNPDGSIGPVEDKVLGRAIQKSAVHMFAFTQWTDENRATDRRMLELALGPLVDTRTKLALAALLWTGIDDLAGNELRKGIRPGSLLREVRDAFR